MPANDTYWRNLKKMHVVFALSAIGLLVATLGMMWADHSDEWRPYQKTFDRLEERRLELQIQANTSDEYEARLEDLNKKLAEANANYAEQKGGLEAEIRDLEYDVNIASRELRNLRAFRDKARADYDLAVRDEKTELAETRKADFDEKQEAVNEQELVVQQLTTQLNQKKQTQQDLRDRVTQIETEIAATTKEVDRLAKAKERIAPESGLAYYKRKIMQWPIIDGFNSPHKVQQIWLPDLKVTLGMAHTARFDRCQTCHLAIDQVATGNLPAFPHDDSLDSTSDPTDEQVEKWVTENKYPHPYSTHPNPDLYLTSTSPHPIQDFGCTICHDGQGSGTSFDNVQHTPNNPHQHELWEEKYHYHPNHFWEYPMQPERFRESTCIKCHHSVVELETSPQFGNSAPKLVKGFHTIEQYGCFGCHEIHGQDGKESIGPDLRVEPNHFAVAQAIAAAAKNVKESEAAASRLEEIQRLAHQVAEDPEDTPAARQTLQDLVLADRGLENPLFDNRIHFLAEELKDVENPGKYRKVGPALRHINTKTTQGWLEFWTNDPQEFRPTTRMPKFFHLTNQEDELAEAYQPVQIAAIGHYLLAKSQPVELLSPPEGYQPNPQRGKDLFAERGCLSCHSHRDFPEIKKDFGPNLDKVYAKLKPGAEGFQWLYSWIRDPQRYHKRSKMPNLFLESYVQDGDKATVDPAADIAAYLLKDRDTTSEDYKPYDVKSATVTIDNEEKSALDALVQLNLLQSLTAAQIEELEKTRVYPIKPELIKGDEIELVHEGEGAPNQAEWQAMKLNYLGRRTIAQYGCYGCHDVPGFEAAKPIGVALQDWGRKDTSRLAFEHIEEFLHHHSAPGSESTLTEQVDQAIKAARAEEFKTEEEAKEELSKAFYYDSILHHGRPGFIWQKLRQPRSYDYKKTETKRYDERLKMPRFPFNSEQIEAVATFVLGLTAEPPAEKYLFKPKDSTLSRYEGEALLTKYNCTSCHMVELPEVYHSIQPRETREDVLAWILDNREAITAGELGRDKYPPLQRQIDDQAQAHANSTLKELVEQAAQKSGGDEAAMELYLNKWFDQYPKVLAPTYADYADVGMTLEQTIDWFVENRQGLMDGSLGTYPEDVTKIQTLCELFGLEIDIRGIANLANVTGTNGQRRLSPAESEARYRANLAQWFDNHPETLLVSPDTLKDPKQGKLPEGVKALFKIKPPRSGETTLVSKDGHPVLRFRGLGVFSEDDQEYSYDLWETLQVGGRIMLPTSKMLFVPEQVVEIRPGRGGEFADFLANHLAAGDMSKLSKGRQSSPPPLMGEGLKVQTPWLFNFIKNPEKIRYETKLRMPRFNMSDAEAQALANYFAAVENAEYPYQNIPQKQPGYISTQTRHYLDAFPEDAKEQPDYLARSWTMFGKFAACRKCHSVAGDEFKVLNPADVTHGPDLDQRLASRFRPDYLDAWLHSPQWILPYTAMVGPTGDPLAGYFHKDPSVQVKALRDAMLNYNELLQRVGKIEPPPPEQPAATPATGQE